ncbi:MAG: hypothetical protein IT376_05850 [Polyangiaceae bacterium]|nr:hypothetical protein [Polyangiaceae bacterium]
MRSRPASRGSHAVAAVAWLALAGCREAGSGPAGTGPAAARARGAAPAPADVGSDCADVGAARACWSEGSPGSVLGVVAVPRPPPPHGAPGDWRCRGAGAERTCAPAAESAGPFECAGDRCTQRFPRLPDDHEWECADVDGVVICRSWSAGAGFVPGRPDSGYRCGAVRGEPEERVCVDFAPDRPPGEPWDCSFGNEPGTPSRTCVRGGREPLGRRCGSACPFGAVCAGDRCLPLAARPDCWTDRDCAPGARCAFATCREPPR